MKSRVKWVLFAPFKTQGVDSSQAVTWSSETAHTEDWTAETQKGSYVSSQVLQSGTLQTPEVSQLLYLCSDNECFDLG